MNSAELDKLKHDFLNSIVIINSMTKSASNYLDKLLPCVDRDTVNQQQFEKFLYSMKAIREQTAKIENYFQSLTDGF